MAIVLIPSQLAALKRKAYGNSSDLMHGHTMEDLYDLVKIGVLKDAWGMRSSVTELGWEILRSSEKSQTDERAKKSLHDLNLNLMKEMPDVSLLRLIQAATGILESRSLTKKEKG